MPSTVEPPVSLSGSASGVDYFIDCPTGTVEHYFADDTYNWSDELYRIHGYERGDVVPTLELGMSHIDPADRDAVRAFWTEVITTGGPSTGAEVARRGMDLNVHRLTFA